ncbi:hypothetical protein ADJ70_11935 [Olsenella sp. oral taxon 807]|uniref:hypothetical protein n=1 Tax=Olsenella sp. oral taxon 807 TaxID=712411 RepID=UPI00067A3592|nr:hypothetical protein [Olsenella sp. oral taxon 807]AKT50056.1 hypothetical protein ADJ70_11935 [Olsenella sp. oral taxon 807]
MPSWNVHTAHVERLFSDRSPQALGIRDANAFLFGNFVPDIYVGYMVREVTHTIDYRDTHFVDPSYVPEPRYWEFWERFGLPSADSEGRVSDLVLGVWCHLVADHGYNHEVNAFIKRNGVQSGEKTRVRKQGDFDLFGRTLDISLECQVTAALIEQAATFPQYAIAEADARAAVAAADAIVRDNAAHHIDQPPAYSLLPSSFFAETFDLVSVRLKSGLEAYAREGAGAPILTDAHLDS